MTQPAHTDRCPNCFEPNPGQPCPHCGWEEGLSNEAPFLPLGTLLNGCYRVGRVLGHGGFGITYLAWDENLELRLAIKEYLPLYLATRTGDRATVSVRPGEAREQFDHGLAGFLDEARALARFDQHPGIVGVKGFFRANGTGYMVMEYVDGITLKTYLERHGGRIPFQTALALLMPVMDALRAVHKVDLLHRDIAPDNIYIATGGQVKLLDFGAARAAVRDQSQSLSMIFKPGYAPWEQCHKGGRQGPWTDVYALAATLYRAITGSPPPESPDRMEQDEFKAPRDLGLDLPTAAEQALIAALAVKPRDRTQDIQTLQQGLQGRVPPVPPPMRDPAPDPIAKPKTPSAPGPVTMRTGVRIAVGFLALMALMGLLVWMGTRQEHERDDAAYRAARSAEVAAALAQGRAAAADQAAADQAAKAVAELQAREAARLKAEQEQFERQAQDARAAEAARREAAAKAQPVRARQPFEPEAVVRRFFEAVSQGYCAEAIVLRPGFTEERCHASLPVTRVEVTRAAAVERLTVVRLEFAQATGDFHGFATLAQWEGRWVIDDGSFRQGQGQDTDALTGYMEGSEHAQLREFAAGMALPVPAAPAAQEGLPAPLAETPGPQASTLVPAQPQAAAKAQPARARQPFEPEMVTIEAGSFLMGSPAKEPERGKDEGPQHRVQVPAFELGKTEVTFAQWDACVADGGCTQRPEDQGWGRGQHPVINVSWDDAQDYVAWLNQKTVNKGYRLPSEAEWEYAARAGTTTPFSTGDCIKTDQALYNGTWDYNGCGAKTGAWMKKTQPVGSYAANPWGLRDMNGNVWEWVEDCRNDGDLAARTSRSARRHEQCEKRLVRGGSWYDGPRYLRSASRFKYPSNSRLKFLGFRLARALIP